MSLAIAGMGWVTPLGNGVDPVWDRLLHGDEASATAISEKFGDRSYSAFRVPESALTGLTHPRLRRASVIARRVARCRVRGEFAEREANCADLRDLQRRRHLHQTLLSRCRRDGCAVGQSALVSGNGF